MCNSKGTDKNTKRVLKRCRFTLRCKCVENFHNKNFLCCVSVDFHKRIIAVHYIWTYCLETS
jgi:hypothetical protein